MERNIKKNFLYSAFLTTANYIFPLITFPYITRVIGAQGIGICDFVDSIINYFILFSTMGIAVVGIREIASSKDDYETLSKSYSGLVSVIGLFTLIGICILTIVTFTIPKIYEHWNLMVFGGFKILFNFLLIEWFYKGLEEFRYITIRTLIIKIIYVILVFIFIRNANDYANYYLLTVLMIGANSLINSIHARRYVKFKFSFPQKAIIYAFLIYGVYSILTSFYTTFNVTYLGFATNTTQVGYYTTATRLFNIFLALFSAFNGVMLPRMSSLIKDNKIIEFKKYFCKSIDILCSVTIPIMFFTFAMAPDIIIIIAGNGFNGSIIPMRIVIPLLFIIGYEQILINQALMPLRKDKSVLINSFFGAIFGIAGNIFLVSKFGANGSAIVWVSSEIIILILSQIAIKKEIQETFPLKKILKFLIFYSPILLVSYLSIIIIDRITLLIVALSFTIFYWIFSTYIIAPDTLLLIKSKDLIWKKRIYQ